MSVVSTIFDTQAQKWAYAVWGGKEVQFCKERFDEKEKAAEQGAAYAGKQFLAPLFSKNGQFVSILTQDGRTNAVIVALPQNTASKPPKPHTYTYTPIRRYSTPPTLAEILKCALNVGLPCVPDFLGHFPMPSPSNLQSVVADQTHPPCKIIVNIS